MLNEKLQQALNEQLVFELYSGYVYYSMAAYCHDQDLDGMANWMHMQAQEELIHANKFFQFIVDKDGRVSLDAVPKPAIDWDSPLAAFQNALEHEQEVTRRIYNLVDLAEEVKDRATAVFLEWFVNEQVEEEANVKNIVQQLKMVQDAPGGMFMLDRELSQRSAPAAGGGAEGGE